jgi:hypothetical protein
MKSERGPTAGHGDKRGWLTNVAWQFAFILSDMRSGLPSTYVFDGHPEFP